MTNLVHTITPGDPLNTHVANGGYVFANFKGTCYDGDTWKGVIDQGMKIFRGNTDFNETIRVRVEGINTPEIRPLRSRTAATLVRDFAQAWIDQNPNVVILSKRWSRDKYGDRISGDFYCAKPLDGVTVNGYGYGTYGDHTLSDCLLSWGFAHAYDGGKKRSFTSAEMNEIIDIFTREIHHDRA